MPIKRVHVLANSVKKSQHCIAGREVLSRGGVLSFGDWIRPVSRHGEGELSRGDCRFPNGRTPEVFDVVDIPLDGHEGSVAQPENWYIDAKGHWRKVAIDAAALPELVIDRPRRLWMAPGQRVDRISPEALKRLGANASLYLIKVARFRIQLGWNERDGRQSRRRRALFEYRGEQYDFSLTDPVMDRYCRPFPGPDEGPRTVRLPGGDDCTLCVSLAPPFQGYHYKIVATVIER